MYCESFAPIRGKDARLLIVGSMPGKRSLEIQQYYAHPQNAFWRILFETLDEPFTADYAARVKLISNHRIILWDSACACLRDGSLDSSMKEIRLNDFTELFFNESGIQTVLCNGKTAYDLFLRAPGLKPARILRMPSTSPAYTMPYEEKYRRWSAAIREGLNC